MLLKYKMKLSLFLFFFPAICAFQTMIERSLNNIQQLSLERGIDDSHNHKHSQEVLYYAKELMKDVSLTTAQKKVIILGSLFHDMNDHKYPPHDLDRLIFEISKVEEDPHLIARTILFTENVSFSKTVKKVNGGLKYSIPRVIENCEDSICFDIIRNADLLASYNLRRAFEYRLHKNPDTPIEMILEEVSELFTNRMLPLRSSHVLTLEYPRCEALSLRFEKLCQLRLQQYSPRSLEETLEFFEIYPKEDLSEICRQLK